MVLRCGTNMIYSVDDFDIEPFYQSVKADPFLRGFTDGVGRFHDLPTLDKTRLRALIQQNFDLGTEKKGVYLQRTSGTLEESVLIPVDPFENFRQREILIAKLKEERLVEPTDIFVNLFNYKHLYRSASLLDYILEHAGATSVGLGAITPDEYVVNFMRMLKVNGLVGSPSRINQLANYCKAQGLKFPIRKFLFGGEVLPDYFLSNIREQFGVEQIIGLYGAMEIGTFGYSDYSKWGNRYKILTDMIYAEIENPDGDGFGNLVITNKIKKRFPIVRFRLGDIGRLRKEGDVTWFEWKKRGDYGFRIQQTYVFQDMITPLVKDFGRYQIQLSLGERSRTKVRMVVSGSDIVPDKVAHLEAQLRKTIGIAESEYELEVVATSNESDFIMNSVSLKTPLLVDNRKTIRA